MSRVRVVGSGISGLATAWFLTERGADVVVTEAASEPGGLIRSEQRPEGLVETAARAFSRTPRIDTLLRAIGIDAVDAAPVARGRYIHRNGRAQRWPLTVTESAAAAGRVAGAWATRSLGAQGDENVDEWGARVAGRAAVDWLIGPALQGVYAVPGAQLSARAVFSHRARRGSLIAPRDGMGALIGKLHETLRARGVRFEFNARVTVLNDGTPTAICTDAPATAELLSAAAPDVAGAFRRIQMTSLRTVTAFFRPHDGDLHGYGVLFPRAGSIRALGVVFNDDAFPNRSPHRSETWIYEGASLHGTLDVIDAMTLDRSVFTSRHDSPIGEPFVPPAAEIPIYDAELARAIDVVDGGGLPSHIALAGNYLGRLGVSKLIDGAAEAADRLISRHT
jgi:oxygen-dependent protoporphyrinogen oxidase